jgi:hypothetical protein
VLWTCVFFVFGHRGAGSPCWGGLDTAAVPVQGQLMVDWEDMRVSRDTSGRCVHISPFLRLRVANVPKCNRSKKASTWSANDDLSSVTGRLPPQLLLRWSHAPQLAFVTRANLSSGVRFGQ